MNEVEVRRVIGAAIAPYLDDLAHLRLQIFRDWPYLYDGDMDYERQYLATYVRASESLCVLVLDGGQVVGAATGIPMDDETEDFRRPFEATGYDPGRVFYIGELVLQPEYRGRGLGVRFLAELEDHAIRLGRFDWAALCAVDRPADHPRRPADAIVLDGFWSRRGYVRSPELHTTYVWKDLDETEQSPKPMTFWIKAL